MALALALLGLASLVPATAVALPDQPPPLVADIIVNGRETGTVIELAERDGGLWARRDDLRGLGLIVPEGAPDEAVRLDALPNTHVRVDAAAGVVRIDAGIGAIAPTRLGMGMGTAGRPVTRGGAPAAILNYDLELDAGGSEGVMANGTLDGRFSDGPVSIDTTALVRVGGGSRFQRLDSTLTYSDPDRLRRYSAGDVISGSLGWSRAVRLGGLQIASDFALRPDLVTTPVPATFGSAAVPTTLDVLVNGISRLSQPVAQGPFEIARLPILTGANRIAVTTTDALGRQVVQDLTFYSSPEMLGRGLTAFSAEIGAVREDYGLNNRYGGLAASAVARRGLTNGLTVEGHGEAARGLVGGGAGLVATVFNLGSVSVAMAGSDRAGRLAGLASIGFEHVEQAIRIGISYQRASAGYRDLAAINSDTMPRSQLRASGSADFGRFGSFGLAYAMLTVPGSAKTRLLSSSWTKAAGRRVQIFGSAYHDFGGHPTTGAMCTLSLQMGRHATMSLSTTRTDGQQDFGVQASRSVSDIGSWGWQVSASGGGDARGFGELRYRAATGEFGLGVDDSGSRPTVRATASGALVLAGGGLFAADRIDDSFAVIETDGEAGVPVTFENRPIGVTDRHGRLLAADLRAYQANDIAIDPTGLPIGTTVDQVETTVVPQSRSGVMARFPMRRLRAAVAVLVDEAGAPLPPGSAVRIAGGGGDTLIGYGGEVYLEDAPAHATLQVRGGDGGLSCAAAFVLPANAPPMPRIGPLVCRRPAR